MVAVVGRLKKQKNEEMVTDHLSLFATYHGHLSSILRREKENC